MTIIYILSMLTFTSFVNSIQLEGMYLNCAVRPALVGFLANSVKDRVGSEFLCWETLFAVSPDNTSINSAVKVGQWSISLR